MQIGRYKFDNPVFLAPMAGITDSPFRQLCCSMGAGHAISEMTTSKPELRNNRKTLLRLEHRDETGPIHIQIAGSNPEEMAMAARFCVENGADIIDINMGCPAKKVCRKLAGSSLLRDEGLVREIIESVVLAVDVPVTLKTRTGWDAKQKNAVRVGRIAEAAGVAAVTLHGRARNDFYKGRAEFDSLRRLRDAVSIPLIANGDITSAEQAARVLTDTGADAVMIGRAARLRPWLPGKISAFLASGVDLDEPDAQQKRDILLGLVRSLHQFYGPGPGTRMARKHISWQLTPFSPPSHVRQAILKAPTPKVQLDLIETFLSPDEIAKAA